MLNILVAISTNQVIGVNNQLPWHLPADLKYFKQLTTGRTIIMGRKTYESIGKALPHRRNIVITQNKDFKAEGAELAYSLEEAIEMSKQEEQVFIIGGGTIYAQSLSLVSKLYVTRVHIDIENGNAFFPIIDLEEWRLVSATEHPIDEKNLLACTFEIYERY